LAQQGNKLTVCYYENPAAKQEIKFWEGLVEDKIQSRSYVSDIWSYHLKDDGESELVICIPIDMVSHTQQISGIADREFSLHLLTGLLYYNKTLIFGKVDSEQLEIVHRITNLMELGKWR
jgi:hypothetical protein